MDRESDDEIREPLERQQSDPWDKHVRGLSTRIAHTERHAKFSDTPAPRHLLMERNTIHTLSICEPNHLKHELSSSRGEAPRQSLRRIVVSPVAVDSKREIAKTMNASMPL